MSLVRFNNDTLPVFSGLMESLFGRDMHDLTNRAVAGSTLPAVNIKEDNDNFCVEVAAPGLRKEDFKVVLENNLLVISSEKEEKHEEKDQEANYTRREFKYHSFRRSFSMPNTADAEKIKANYKDGVLKIQIPKKEEAKQKPPKTIQIA